jgi:hypothetical protein
MTAAWTPAPLDPAQTTSPASKADFHRHRPGGSTVYGGCSLVEPWAFAYRVVLAAILVASNARALRTSKALLFDGPSRRVSCSSHHPLMTRSRMIVLCALALAACSGGTGEATVPDASPPSVAADASSPSLEPLYQELYPELPHYGPDGGPPDDLASQCLPRPLPLAADGLPNCIVVAARSLGDSDQIAACGRCTDPGLEPLVTGIALDRIGEGLSNFSCVCAVRALADDLACQSGGAGWCYRGANAARGPCSTGAIMFPAVPFGSLTYVACFEPGVN